ncbi:hypothetical protein CLAIMM_03649 [Cladophialophora immunda]|nr:hypothetical protein CLAIMM_03649 [Cladophialophora immunda]
MLLASRGALVVVNDLPDKVEQTQAVVSEIKQVGGRAAVVTGGVGVDEDARTIEMFNRIDIVITTPGSRVEETQPTHSFKKRPEMGSSGFSASMSADLCS